MNSTESSSVFTHFSVAPPGSSSGGCFLSASIILSCSHYPHSPALVALSLFSPSCSSIGSPSVLPLSRRWVELALRRRRWEELFLSGSTCPPGFQMREEAGGGSCCAASRADGGDDIPAAFGSKRWSSASRLADVSSEPAAATARHVFQNTKCFKGGDVSTSPGDAG